jgi:hypothetical protein
VHCGLEVNERDKWPDPVRRVKDEMDYHATVIHEGGERGYAVFSMQDGRPVTHHLYPSRGHARRDAEKLTTDFLLIIEASPDGMPYREADAVLRYERTLNNMGARTPDTLETEENSGLLSMPRNRHDRRAMAAQLKSGKPLYSPDIAYGNTPSLKRGTN